MFYVCACAYMHVCVRACICCRIFPWGIKIGMAIVIFAYILANIAYMSLLSAQQIIETTVIAVVSSTVMLSVSTSISLSCLSRV